VSVVLALALLSLVIGVGLGTRYKVLVLVPAIICAVPLALLVGLYLYGTAGLVIFAAASTVVLLQVGYVVGVVVQSRLEVLRGAERISSAGPGLAH
jgi:hypothetical protein